MIQEISFLQLGFAYLFMVLVLVLSYRTKVGREKEIVIACVRMTVQLIAVGYLLTLVFAKPNPVVTIIIIGFMGFFAVDNIKKRIRGNISKAFKRIIVLAMWASSLICLLYFVIIVIGISPWYNPQYFIPVAGMIFGNSMNGIALGATRLIKGFEEQSARIETALMLGATPKKAVMPILRDAFDNALMPTINSMLGMGIVSLPGMMTGQILAGNSPLIATRYQIGIMLAIAGSVALASALLVELGYRTFFNKKGQLQAMSSFEAK